MDNMTIVFDNLCCLILDKEFLLDEEKEDLLYNLILIFEKNNWKCQDNTSYWNNALVKKVFKKIHPEWFTENA